MALNITRRKSILIVKSIALGFGWYRGAVLMDSIGEGP